MRTLPALALVLTLAACGSPEPTGYDPATDSLRFSGELHLRNVRQLTFGGNNAEAYWSYDDSLLVFQTDWSALNDQGCDQQFVMDAGGRALGPSTATMREADSTMYRRVSTGTGRTTCGYFLPNRPGSVQADSVVFASTHEASRQCPVVPGAEGDRYVWAIYPTYDIYAAPVDGGEPRLLIGGDGYDAEATVSPDGRYVVFTSTRSGDLDLWRYDRTTGETVQLTNDLGYDGGAFFSPDGSQIVWRASRPTGEAARQYRRLLRDGLVEPSDLELFVANADGSEAYQVTSLGGANWAPFFHPSGDKILFASNHHSDGGRLFDLFLVDLDGTGLEQVTHSGTFDAFPMFSFAGDRLVFASNRRTDRAPSRDTNVFVADWVDVPEGVDSTFQTITVAE